jgi:hypothetical protein
MISMRPDVYEMLQGHAEDADLSCSRLVESLIVGTHAHWRARLPDLSRRLAVLAGCTGQEVDDVVAQALDLGVRRFEEIEGLADDPAEAGEASIAAARAETRLGGTG